MAVINHSNYSSVHMSVKNQNIDSTATQTIFNNKMVESAAAKKIHSFLLHATAKKHQSYERDYQPFAVKDFVEAVINQTSPISIKDDSVYMGDQQFNYWIDGLSWNQQLSFGQLSSDQKEKLVHLLYDLQHSKEEPFSLMRVLFYNLDYNFANEGQFSKYKKGEIEWEDLICKSYIEGTTYSLINIAMRFPDKLVKIMKSNAETMKVRMTQERYERLMSLIPKTISLLQSYSFLLNEYVLKYSLPKHPDSDKRYEVFRGLDLVKKYSEKKNTSAVSSYSSEIKTAAYFAGDYKTPKTSIAMCSTNSNPKNFCELILNLWSSFADPADYQSAVVPVATPKDDNQYPVVTEASEKEAPIAPKNCIIKKNVAFSDAAPGNYLERELILPIGFRRLRATSIVEILPNLIDPNKITSTKIAIGRIPKPLIKKLHDSEFNDQVALSEFLALANTFTLNRPYPDGSSRGNHNGMHSLRQLRLLEYIINQLSPKNSETFNQFSSEEQFVLKCGAIFLRSGRIDETSHQSGDDWYARSFRIFSEYMTQLGIKEETIQWMKPIMCESCKPESAFKNASFRESLNVNPKTKLAFESLNLAHQLDLVRLRNDLTFVKPKLAILDKGKESYSEITELARSLLKVTGSEYDQDIKIFKENSFNFIEIFSRTETILHKFIDTKKDKKNEVAIDENRSNEIEIKKISLQMTEDRDVLVKLIELHLKKIKGLSAYKMDLGDYKFYIEFI